MKKIVLAWFVIMTLLVSIGAPTYAADVTNTMLAEEETVEDSGIEDNYQIDENDNENIEDGNNDGENTETGSNNGEGEEGENDNGGENESEQETETPASEVAPQPAPSAPGTKSTVKVLMIGSSFTYRMHKDNYTIPYLKELAKSGNKKLSVTKCIHPSGSMASFASSKNKWGRKARKLIKSKKWDYIVLQAACDRTIRHPSRQKKGLVKLAKYIHKVNKKTTVVYNCTWAHNYSSRIGGRTFRPKDKYNRMMKVYNYAYQRTKSYSICCYSGKAFNECKKHRNLFVGDREHPNRYGAMLHAACLYAVFFKTSPTKAAYTAGLKKDAVKHLKTVADKYCLNKK